MNNYVTTLKILLESNIFAYDMPFKVEQYNSETDEYKTIYRSWIDRNTSVIPEEAMNTEVIYVNIGNCSDIDMPCLVIEIAED